jgi:hypothetical protein
MLSVAYNRSLMINATHPLFSLGAKFKLLIANAEKYFQELGFFVWGTPWLRTLSNI